MSSVKELRLKVQGRLYGIFGERLNSINSIEAGYPTRWLGSIHSPAFSEETFKYLKVDVIAIYNWISGSVSFRFTSYDHRVQNYLSSLGEGATPEEVAEMIKLIAEDK